MQFVAGDVVKVDFPGVTGVKRRPAVVLSSGVYHQKRPDVIVGLITSQTSNLCETDHCLQDWSLAGLRVASAFRSFIVPLPPAANLVKIGHLLERDWQAIQNSLKTAMMLESTDAGEVE